MRLAERRRDEAGEERVRPRRARLELRVELAADEVRVRLELDHLDERAVRREAAQQHAAVRELVAILVGDLVAVAMALADVGGAIDLGRARAAREAARV